MHSDPLLQTTLAQLRQRNALYYALSADARDGDEGFREALLPHGSSSDQDDQQQHRKQVMVYQGPFDLRNFLASIFSKCLGFLDRCWHELGGAPCWQAVEAILFPGWSAKNQQLSLIQEERLEQLWGNLCLAFTPEDSEHQQALRDLWGYAFPGEPYTTLKNQRWKDMGWQGDDPTTDIRGAGLFGIQNLLYFARTYPGEFDRLLKKRTGQRSSWEYPFAAAGLNLTFAIAEMLGLKHAKPTPPGSPRPPVPMEHIRKQLMCGGFFRLLSSEPQCFEELYCAAFIALDEEWLKQQASYMQFNAVLKKTLEQVANAVKQCGQGSASIQRLHSLLGIEGLRELN